MAFTGRMKELMRKYGKVALGVHLSVSAASIGGLYVAIKNNVDVEAIFQKVGMSSGAVKQQDKKTVPVDPTMVQDSFKENSSIMTEGEAKNKQQNRNRTAELAATETGVQQSIIPT